MRLDRALGLGPANSYAIQAAIAALHARAPRAARADLLRRAGRFAEARADYEHALGLAGNEPEKRYLRRRLLEVTALLAAGSS